MLNLGICSAALAVPSALGVVGIWRSRQQEEGGLYGWLPLCAALARREQRCQEWAGVGWVPLRVWGQCCV